MLRTSFHHLYAFVLVVNNIEKGLKEDLRQGDYMSNSKLIDPVEKHLRDRIKELEQKLETTLLENKQLKADYSELNRRHSKALQLREGVKKAHRSKQAKEIRESVAKEKAKKKTYGWGELHKTFTAIGLKHNVSASNIRNYRKYRTCRSFIYCTYNTLDDCGCIYLRSNIFSICGKHRNENRNQNKC